MSWKADGKPQGLIFAALVGITLLLSACTTFPLSNGPFTYYVSGDGDDSARGNSEESAWATLERASEEAFAPGDTVVLSGDQVLSGTLSLTSEDGGDPELPLTVTATDTFPGINAQGKSGIEIIDTSGVIISGIEITVDVGTSTKTEGILLYATPGSGLHKSISIQDTEVRGANNGIVLSSESEGDGFARVVIERVIVKDGKRNGILAHGPEAPNYAHEDLRISDSLVSGISGIAGAEQNTGSGYVIGSVDGVLIEHSEATKNGALSDAFEGPIGMWAHDSTNVVFRDNHSHGNLTAEADGGGFGFDVSTSNALMERNLAHDNTGPGYLVLTHSPGKEVSDVILRYNASIRDAAKYDFHGGISLMGGLSAHHNIFVRNISVHHNTVVSSSESGAPALKLLGNLQEVGIHHNIFYTSAGQGKAVVASELHQASEVSFSANQLFSATADASGLISWDGESAIPGVNSDVISDPQFKDTGRLPEGLEPSSWLLIDAVSPDDVQPAERDLLGRQVPAIDPSVGAVSPAD